MIRTLVRTGSALLALLLSLSSGALEAGEAGGPPRGRGAYAELVALQQELQREAAQATDAPRVARSKDAVTRRLAALSEQRARLEDMNVAQWTRDQQVDWLLVRSEVLRREFELRVLRPWARDPGFYVDPLLQLAFTELPVPQGQLADFERRLREVPRELEAARSNLDAAAADLAELALRNLERADGVGHEQPRRAVPPAGAIGW
jgi:hypothetical protein